MGTCHEDRRCLEGHLDYEMCDHLYDTTTRYDSNRKLLTFLLYCPICRTESVVETLAYEPAFRPAQHTLVRG